MMLLLARKRTTWSWSTSITEASPLPARTPWTCLRFLLQLRTASLRGSALSSQLVGFRRKQRLCSFFPKLKVASFPPDWTVCVLFCRCLSLRIHFDLHQCHQASCTDLSEQRAQRRAWQQSLNHQIQRIALELLVNIFRSHASSSPTSSSTRMMVSAFGI